MELVKYVVQTNSSGDWSDYSRSFETREEAVNRAKLFRERLPRSEYRVVKYTVSMEVQEEMSGN